MENVRVIIFEGGNNSTDILEQFLSSSYYENNQLNINRFLDEDRTIDLEKLELAIILLIEHLEKSVKINFPIYVNLGNMNEYVVARGIEDDIEKITEESKFIIGFCQSIATENEIDNKIIVRFKGKDDV
jgi:hypothetical protein